MSKVLKCSICGSTQKVMSVISPGRITAVDINSVDGNLHLGLISGHGTREFCAACQRYLQSAISSAVFNLKKNSGRAEWGDV